MNVNSIDPGDIVMIGDIADRQEVTKSTVQKWMARPDFPEPIARLRAGDVYDYGAVVVWRREHVAAQRARLEKKLEEL